MLVIIKVSFFLAPLMFQAALILTPQKKEKDIEEL